MIIGMAGIITDTDIVTNVEIKMRAANEKLQTGSLLLAAFNIVNLFLLHGMFLCPLSLKISLKFYEEDLVELPFLKQHRNLPLLQVAVDIFEVLVADQVPGAFTLVDPIGHLHPCLV